MAPTPAKREQSTNEMEYMSFAVLVISFQEPSYVNTQIYRKDAFVFTPINQHDRRHEVWISDRGQVLLSVSWGSRVKSRSNPIACDAK